MKIDLKEYLQNRDRYLTLKKIPGPVITISREYGCEGTLVARKIVQHFNDPMGSFRDPWKYISKEILYESARELKLAPNEVQHVLHPHDRNLVEELFTSFSTRFRVDEQKIHNTIKEVIMNYAIQGNVVILGQGGVAITKDIDRSLHVKLIAPLDWRVRRLSQKLDISEKEAKEKANEYDHRRTLCIDHFMESKTDYGVFDIILNTSTLTTNQITEEILHAAGLKELVGV